MIVFASQRDHHYSEDVNQGTANKKPLRTKLVEHEAPLQAHVRVTHTQSDPGGGEEGRRTYNDGQEVQNPLHEAGDPRDGGRGVLAERIVHIVRLKDADAVAQSEGAEEDAPCPE